VAGLNETLLVKAAAAKLLRTDMVRADTTVVEADVAYPTDSGLLAKAVGKIARTVQRIDNAPQAPQLSPAWPPTSRRYGLPSRARVCLATACRKYAAQPRVIWLILIRVSPRSSG
jgi:IS5 family transposase